jgi:hypothetical protein
MIHKGVFGYIIGRKKRFMYVENDANLLWRILVREIYVIMKHFQSKETFLEAFNKIKIIKDITLLKSSVIEKCKIFLDQEDKENFLLFIFFGFRIDFNLCVHAGRRRRQGYAQFDCYPN